MKWVSLLILFIALLLTNFLAATEVRMVTEDFPPLNYLENGTLVGPSVDIVNAIKQNLGVKNDIEVFPWKRAYNIALKNANSCVFSTTRTKSRENIFKWVGPLSEKRYVFYALKKSHIKINNIEDAKKYLVGVQSGGASNEFLKGKGFSNLDEAINPSQSLRKLIHERIQLWYTSTTTPLILAKKESVDVSQIEEVFVVKSSQLYVAFNKDTPDNVVNKWDAEFKKLYKDGTIKSIFSKYHLESLYPKIK